MNEAYHIEDAGRETLTSKPILRFRRLGSIEWAEFRPETKNIYGILRISAILTLRYKTGEKETLGGPIAESLWTALLTEGT